MHELYVRSKTKQEMGKWKWPTECWMGRVVQPSYWRESLHIAALITLMRNPNPHLCILQTLICFNPILECQRLVLKILLCVNLLNSATLTWMTRHLPTPLWNWKVHWFCWRWSKRHTGTRVFLRLDLVNYWWHNPKQRWEFTPIKRFLEILQQADIMLEIPQNTDQIHPNYTWIS